MCMADEPTGADGAVVLGATSGLPVTGNPMVDGLSRLLLFLESLVRPQQGVPSKCPADLDDVELRDAACKVAITLVDGLGLIVQEGPDASAADDPSWHRRWPRTVEAFVRSMFMTGFDAFGTAAVALGTNTSVTSISNVRVVAECHVLMRWVLDGETETEQLSRVLAMTRAGIDDARRSLAHWDRATHRTQESHMVAYVRETLDDAQWDLDELIDGHGLTLPSRPDSAALFDRYLPRGYVTFTLASDIGAPPGPSPFFFYGESETGTDKWGYRGLHVERALWIAEACWIQLENYQLAAPVCGWVNHEHFLKHVADDLAIVDAEAEKRFATKRDPDRTWL